MADEVLTQLEDLDLLKELEFKPGQTLTAEQLNRMLKLIELAVRNSGTTIISQIKEIFVDNPDFSSRIDNLEGVLKSLFNVAIYNGSTEFLVDDKNQISIIAENDLSSPGLTIEQIISNKIDSELLINDVEIEKTNNTYVAIVTNLEFSNPYIYYKDSAPYKTAGIWLWKHDGNMPNNNPVNEYLWRPVMPYAQFRAKEEIDAQYSNLFGVIDAGSY